MEETSSTPTVETMPSEHSQNIPSLRFPEFTLEPVERKLGDVAAFKSGGTPAKDNPKYWNGDIPWISAASMAGKYFSNSERTLTELGLKNGSKLAAKGSLLLLVRGSMLFNKIPVGIAEKAGQTHLKIEYFFSEFGIKSSFEPSLSF